MVTRRPRRAAEAAAASIRTPIPNLSDNEDEEMTDIVPANAPTPQEDEGDVEDADGDPDDDGQQDEDEPEDAEDEATPTRGSPLPSRSATPRRRGRGRGRGRARGRIARLSRRNNLSDDETGAASDGTPRRRGGFRGRGRWGKAKGGPSRLTQAPLDDDGNVMEVEGDEIVLPEDSEGEQKVDKNGHLQNGREYRVRTFTLIGRGKRLYMLSTEPARCIGFRDSYLFFQKHKHLYKIIIDEDEKRDLIDRDLIPHSYKGRAIGVVTARSVYREFGAKIVIAGKKVTDDYDVKGARERGDVEGELAVPDDRMPGPGEQYNRNQYVAWHGASAVYHQGPTIPLTTGKFVEGKRKRVMVTRDNWMLEHAREASRFNASLAAIRRDNQEGVYDIHTNVMQWPKNLQPSHARWDVVTNDFVIHEDDGSLRRLPSLDPIYARNFRIHDLYLESAPETNMGPPGFDGEANGLASVPSNVVEELPTECLRAFEEARSKELAWKSKWLTESVDGQRAHFLSSVEWWPK